MDKRFVIKGQIKPYVRMTRRGMWKSHQAQEYLNSQASITAQFIEQMQGHDAEKFPRQTPLSVELRFYHMGGFHNKDLDNQIKAVLDAMNGVVYPDDRWIDQIQASRYVGKAETVNILVRELDSAEEAKGEILEYLGIREFDQSI